MNADDGYHSGRPVRMTRLIGDSMKTIKERKKQSGIRYDNAPRPFEKRSTTNVEADDVYFKCLHVVVWEKFLVYHVAHRTEEASNALRKARSLHKDACEYNRDAMQMMTYYFRVDQIMNSITTNLQVQNSELLRAAESISPIVRMILLPISTLRDMRKEIRTNVLRKCLSDISRDNYPPIRRWVTCDCSCVDDDLVSCTINATCV